MRVINEPTLVATSLGLEEKHPEIETAFGIVDIGLQGMSVTVIVIEDGIYLVTFSRYYAFTPESSEQQTIQHACQLLMVPKAPTAKRVDSVG